MTIQTKKETILDRLTFDAFMKVNSIKDDDVRSDVIAAINEIPFIYNILRKDRKRAKDLPRDSSGKIIVNIVEPHMLEDMDYFTERAIYFNKNGKYCDLVPNRHPRSRYMQFWREEQRRCREGYVRESDGEWITGYFYWYLNYCPIQLTEEDFKDEKATVNKLKLGAKKFIDDIDSELELGSLHESSGMVQAERKEDFPRIWDSDYFWFHYIDQAACRGEHGVNIKTRGRGYSFKGGSKGTRNYYHFKGSKSFMIASEGDYLLGDGILNKAWDILNFVDNNTPWRKSRDYADRNDHKKASYKDPKTKTERGVRSEIIGVSTKGQPERARGKRGKLILFEESGKFPHFLTALAIARPSVEQGRRTFGTIIAWGTGGTEGADFAGIKEVFFKPKAWNMYGLRNVFDRNAPLNATCGYYCGEYMNREGCYDKNGNSDVIAALIEIFQGRQIIARNTNDPNALMQEKADRSITPQEACMKKEGHIFNVEDLKVHASEVEVNPKKYTDASWKVKLYFQDGKVKWKISDNYPVRQFPIIENKGLEGCVEIFEHPVEHDGNIPPNVYCAGIDPYDDDIASGPSLGSIVITNRLTRRIVAEYTGRPQTAEEFYETCYRLMKYYNARGNYENNKKGMFQYFDRIQSTYVLCDTPGILRDMEITKKVGFGNTSKGTNATKAVNNWGNSLIRSYLMEGAYGGEEGKRNYSTIVSPGMLKELIAYDPEVGNYDRIAALRMVLIMMADMEKFGIDDPDEYGNKSTKKAIDPFFLRTRTSLNSRFVSSSTEAMNSKKPIRQRRT